MIDVFCKCLVYWLLCEMMLAGYPLAPCGPFAVVNGVETFPRREVQATEERQPGIVLGERINLHLLANGRVSWANIGIPVQVGAIQKDERRRFGRLI